MLLSLFKDVIGIVTYVTSIAFMQLTSFHSILSSMEGEEDSEKHKGLL